MFRKLLAILLLSTILLGPAYVYPFADQDKNYEAFVEDLANRLATLHIMMNQLNDLMKQMTPEERKQLCREIREEIAKNPPPIPVIIINCQ